MIARSPLGAAIIGLGVGEQHAQTYVDSPKATLKLLYDLDYKKAKKLAKKLGAAFADEQKIFNDKGVQIISIASFDDAHFSQVTSGIRNGKNLFVEKPLCRTISELKEIKKLWLQNNKPAIESNLILRAAPLYKWLYKAISNGELGEIYAFDGDYLYGRLEKITSGWRNQIKDYSVMLGGGIHLVDLMLMMLEDRPVSVSTTGTNIATARSNFKYHDFQAANFIFPSGRIGRITANFGCAHHHQHVVRIFGTKATFIYDDQGARILKLRDHDFKMRGFDANPPSAAQMISQSPLPKHKGELIPQFLDDILLNKNFEKRAQQNFDLISIIAASDNSLQAGTSVNINYV
ncbi:MAG: hypothetical protein CMF69_06705 [Magnetovibrio sp.]|nr:hypothetical protein [Magnetovibrio sp.]|tara:strand:+ start:1216 stop:2256 length:1041 start_codon:yes stop_codon:yes gene_type:complete